MDKAKRIVLGVLVAVLPLGIAVSLVYGQWQTLLGTSATYTAALVVAAHSHRQAGDDQ